ncbi:MAG: hypothetical protein LC099_03175 [Anaerolineales bacterium]|nr:hypothetical protein [Anaerolineales bacterium]
MTINPKQLDEQGKRAFAQKNFSEAADYFRQAAEAYAQSASALDAAESKNNLSVALLQMDRAQEALDAALGTDQTFAAAGDVKRQAMAFGNQAAALEGLKRGDEALQLYERSADLFGSINEGDLRAMVIKSAAALKLKSGKVTDAAFKMMGSVEAKKNPSLFDRIVKFFMKFFG